MKKLIKSININNNHASGYNDIFIRIHQDTNPYNFTVENPIDTNNASSESVVKNIVKRYQKAWEKLAEM